MGRLYRIAQEIERIVADRGLDPYKTKGAISLSTGLIVSLIDEDDPDDEEQITALREAVKAVLGVTIDI